MKDDGPKPRYAWRKTWEDRENDFCGEDNGQIIGRIYREDYGPQAGNWSWFLHDVRAGPAGIKGCGQAPTARLAAKAVEDALDRLIGLVPGR